jgi:hypothetical protein
MVGLVIANVWRQARNIALKGDGCFTDIPNIVELGHSDKLLTRDKELHACGKLLAATVTSETGLRPRIILVPQPPQRK